MSWQEETFELSRKFHYLLETEAFSDVTLIVGKKPEEKRFNMHRLVLSIYSRVFEAMFYGTWAKDDKEFTLPDDDPDTFELMIRCIYTGKISLETPREAMNLLLLSDKYFINQIKLQCIEYLKKNISSDLVFEVYEVATKMSEHRLRLECWKYIQINIAQVWNDRSFELATPSMLIDIVKEHCLCIFSEIELYNAVKRWGISRCERRGVSVSGSNVREEINALLPFIRFLTMSPKQFTHGPATDDIFSPEERLNILRNIIAPELESLPKEFSSLKDTRYRFSPKQQYFYLYCDGSTEISLEYRKLLSFGQQIVFPFSDTYMYGVGLLISKKREGIPSLPRTECSLSIRNMDNNNTMERQNLVIQQNGTELFIVLDDPIYIASGDTYEIELNVSHTEDFVFYCSGDCKLHSSYCGRRYVENWAKFHFHTFLVWNLPRVAPNKK